MHESEGARLAAEKIITARAKHAKIRLGRMRGEKTRFLALVRELLAGSGFESIRIEVEPVDVCAKCSCGFCGKVEVHEHIHFVRCPKCGRVAEVTEGNSLQIITD